MKALYSLYGDVWWEWLWLMVTILIFVGVGFCVSVFQYDHIISYICFLFTGVEWVSIRFCNIVHNIWNKRKNKKENYHPLNTMYNHHHHPFHDSIYYIYMCKCMYRMCSVLLCIRDFFMAIFFPQRGGICLVYKRVKIIYKKNNFFPSFPEFAKAISFIRLPLLQ